MATLPIRGLDELEEHLDTLGLDPSLPLNAKLFDEVSLQLTETNTPPLIPRLLPKLTAIIKASSQDPTVVVELAIKLLGPVTFTQALSLATEDSLVQALRSPVPAANILAMAILHKAAATPDDAAVLSAMPALLSAFLVSWLAAPQVEVGEKGTRVLGDLLATDCDLPPTPTVNGTASSADAADAALILRRAAARPGHGVLWRRLLLGPDLYDELISLVSGSSADGSQHAAVATAHQRSLAQGRLLRLLPRLAALHPAAAAQRLVPFAALEMVDDEDVLMHLSLVDFFEALVSVLRVADRGRAPPTVAWLRTLLRDATAEDPVLRRALWTLHERTVPEEADAVRAWVRELMPASTRVAGWEAPG